MIPLDFVAGTHGHFIEYVLNRAFGFTSSDIDLFNHLGASHKRPVDYLQSRGIVCKHWFEVDADTLKKSNRVIRIVFDKDDILLVSSLSLLRAGDMNINNDQLHIDTKKKLNNALYVDTLEQIYSAYGDHLRTRNSIPRNILREYFKFGFRDPEINGYWKKLKSLLSNQVDSDFRIDLKKIYNIDDFVSVLKDLAVWLDRPIDIGPWLPLLHQKFISKVQYLDHTMQCEQIIEQVMSGIDTTIPKLSILQESYINARLEGVFKKEMPFHDINYFTNTKDVLNYIKLQAPR